MNRQTWRPVAIGKHCAQRAPLHAKRHPGMSRFHARGGKLILYFGLADPGLNARPGIEYWESVARRMGAEKTQGFFRLFLKPGVVHCGGGVDPAWFDTLEAIVPWVEQAKAPARIAAS